MTASPQLIPLSGSAEQFDITLSGMRLTFRVAWRNVGGAGWVLDLIATDTQAVLVAGKPLVVGLDLLGQHRHLGIPGGLWVVPSDGSDDVATFDNLGTNVQLFYVADE